MEIDTFLTRIEPNGLVVLTNNADAIPLGTVFNQLAKRRASRNGDDIEWVDLGVIANVELVLKGIYLTTNLNNLADVVPKGWHAGVRLQGDGLQELEQAVRTKAENEYIHLRALTDA
jgi:hypothetical protein